MSRAELHGLVRNLRQYLEWQAAPLAATVPADDDTRAAVEAAIHERQRALLARTLDAGPSAQAAPQRQAPSAAPKEAPRMQAPPSEFTLPSQEKKQAPPPPAASAPALWKDDNFGAGPTSTFAPAKPQPKPESAAPPQVKEAKASTSAPSSAAPTETLDQIRTDLGDCERCGLCKERKNIVFGVGSPTARLMFIGEGPGFNEDVQGEPFVGKAGELLDKMIKAMTLSRDEVYIANVVKCRPPSNRDPEPDEVAKCGPFLKRQVRSIQPEVIVTLGKFSSNLLTGNDGSLNRVRGKWQEWRGIPVMPTFHPAYLLRKPQDKGQAWDDLKKVMDRLDLSIPEKYR